MKSIECSKANNDRHKTESTNVISSCNRGCNMQSKRVLHISDFVHFQPAYRGRLMGGGTYYANQVRNGATPAVSDLIKEDLKQGAKKTFTFCRRLGGREEAGAEEFFDNEFIAALYCPFSDASKRPQKDKDVELGYLNNKPKITARAIEPELTSTTKLQKFTEVTAAGGSVTYYPLEGNSTLEVIAKSNEHDRSKTDLGWTEKEEKLLATIVECEMKIAKHQANVANKFNTMTGKKFTEEVVKDWEKEIATLKTKLKKARDSVEALGRQSADLLAKLLGTLSRQTRAATNDILTTAVEYEQTKWTV